jgi:hypothetical protein
MERAMMPRILLFALFTVSCTSDSIPGTADVPDIYAEAAGTKEISKWQDSPARKAVRSSFKTMMYFDSVHEAEVRARFQRPHLRSYFMRADSYIGGDFPRQTAVLLREVQQANRNYLLQVESYPSVLNDKLGPMDLSADQKRTLADEMTRAYAVRQKPAIEAVAEFDKFVEAAARLYEVAAANSGSLQSMRTGLETTDGRVHLGFNRVVDDVNRAHTAADHAIRRLPPEHLQRFMRMGIAQPIRR